MPRIIQALGLLIVILTLSPSSTYAQTRSADNLWTLLDSPPTRINAMPALFTATKYQLTQLDADQMLTRLKTAPPEYATGKYSETLIITLPAPDGTFKRFKLADSPIMAPELAAAFPQIKTYSGQGIDDPTLTLRADYTDAGFHASVFSPEGSWYLDPYYTTNVPIYASYYRRDTRTSGEWNCHVENPTSSTADADDAARAARTTTRITSGDTLRTYRLACAATGEYTAFHGGTVSLGQAAIVTAINRVNQLYEADLAIRLVLVANNSSLVYTNANTDPYTNNDGYAMLSENRNNINMVIGTNNYDIGHVFSTGGGGLASLGIVCSTFKAEGVTGLSAPTGDPFYIDYVAHEMGHQFGANHTFNSNTSGCNGNRESTTAMEPGSGSTIMAYAGICGADNLQYSSDAYFHSKSIDEILAHVTTGSGKNCHVPSSTGNLPPLVNGGADRSIPASTPFTLTASATDPNGDAITYCWEERDLGVSTLLSAPDNGSSPIFRSYTPTPSPSRTFPKLENIINNNTPIGEKYPTISRSNMAFRVTARDNRPGGGAISTDDVSLNVVGTAGPFTVTSPNTAVTLQGTITVTWNVANTNIAPINTSQVNIKLSTDGGLTFPTTLTSATANDGTQSIQLPNINTTTARIKIEAANNIYWDISNTNFAIVGQTAVENWSLYN